MQSIFCENVKKDLNKIYKFFGEKLQEEKLNEEIIEMYLEEPGSLKEFKEKVDVWIVLTQHLLQDEKTFEKEYLQKLKRTFARIKRGYYKK